MGKTLWIIGASSGIGEALALELSGLGATLVLSARRQESLDRLKEKLGGRHHVVPIDVADRASVSLATNTVREILPKLDSVVFMAAVYEPQRVENIKNDLLQSMINVNLMGAFHVVEAVLPILKSQGYGQLALCGSVAGYRGLPNGQPYSMTKAAIMNLAESLRIEEPKLDIKLISPGFVQTPMTDKNSFSMPMIITPEAAAKAIAKGLQSRRFEIHFPKRFTCLMKVLRCLPAFAYFRLASRM